MGLLGSLGSLNVLLSADTAQFSSAMDKAAYTAERDLQRISRTAKVNGAIMTAALIATATAFTVKMKSIIDSADDIGKMAQKIGITSEELSKLKYAADLSGVSVEQLSTVMARMNKNVGDGAKVFQELGISTTTANGSFRSGYDILLDFADVISKMPDGVEKASLIVKAFGKSGGDLTPMLNSGKDGLKSFGDEAERAGQIISTNTAKSAEVFNDNMERLAKNVNAAFLSIGSDLIPVLANLSENFKQAGDSTSVFTDAGKGLGYALVTLINTGMFLADTFDTVAKTIGAVGAQILFITRLDFKGAATVLDAYLKDISSKSTNLLEKMSKNMDALEGKSRQASSQRMADAKEEIESNREKIKLDEEGVKLKESLRTAAEKYNDELEYYETLLQGQAIDQETYERAVKKASDGLIDQSKATNKLKDAAKDLGFTFSSAFENAIMEGKKLSDVLVSLLQDIERIAIRTAITEPLANAIAGGITGIFNSGSASGVSDQAYLDPAGFVTASKRGNIFSSGNLVPFANGGLINRPSIFPMANGGTGLAGEAGPEAILPLFRTGGGDLGVKSGGSNVEVNVYAPEGSSVRQERSKSGGNEQINIIIDEAVAGAVGNPGSKTHRALKGSFGLKQALTVR